MSSYRIWIFIFSLCILSSRCTSSDESIIDSTNPDSLDVGIFIDDWTFKVFPKLLDNFDTAEFKLWVPENDDNLKAILILCNHNNGSSFGWLSSEIWRDYATEHNLGILAVNLETITVEGHYSDPTGGSGNALIKALDTIAYRNNINNINKLPFLMSGYSAGGVFSYYFSHFKPERLIAFTNIRGGAVGETSAINNNIPGLMLMGEDDEPSRNERMKNIVLSNRNLGGNWSYATEPNVNHFGGLESSHELVRIFFSSALTLRLSEGSDELKTIPENSGWLGNNETKDVFPFDEYPSMTKGASWLIDETFANHWKAYQFE